MSCTYYNDVIMGATASQTIILTIVYSNVYSGSDQRKHHQSSASLAFVRGIHRIPVNSPHKWPVTRKMFPFDDVIIILCNIVCGTITPGTSLVLHPLRKNAEVHSSVNDYAIMSTEKLSDIVWKHIRYHTDGIYRWNVDQYAHVNVSPLFT